MKKMRKRVFSFIALFVLLFALNLFAQAQAIRDLKPTVILISLDGFRYDYLEKYQPPFLNKLAREGVRAKWLIPAPNDGNFDTAKVVLKNFRN